MASYGINLYFGKSVSREEILRRIVSMVGCKPVPNEPDTYYFDYVHLSLSSIAQENAVSEIRHATGLEVGDFHVEVYVNTAADEAFEERWDRTLELLADGDDAIAVQEFEWVLLIQRDGDLTLDDTGEMLSPYYRDYILRKRPCKTGALGRLGENV